jgi:hypothetical protein
MTDNIRHTVALAAVLALALTLAAAPAVTATDTGGGAAAVTEDASSAATGDALPSQQHAQQSDDAQLRLGSATVNPEDSTVVRVSTDASDVAGYQTNVTFDPSVVQVEGVVGTEDFDDPVVNVNNDEGWVVFTQSGTEGVDEPALARIRFTAVGEDGDSTDLSFVGEDTAVNDADRASVDVALVGGQVDVASGDVVSNDADGGDGDQQNANGDTSDDANGSDGGILGDTSPVVLAGGAAALGGAVAGGVFLGQRFG